MLHINGMFFYQYMEHWYLEREGAPDIRLIRKPTALLEAYLRNVSSYQTAVIPVYRRY